MKLVAVLILSVFSSFAFAGGGYGQGRSEDPCNMTYDGSFQFGGGPLNIRLIRTGYNSVDVISRFRGWVVYGYGYCDETGVRYRLDGAPPQSGRFFYGPYGIDSLRGTQFVNGRPYQGFIVYPW